MVSSTQHFTSKYVYFRNPVYFITKKFYSYGYICTACRIYLNYITMNPECTSCKIHIISVVLNFHKSFEDFISIFYHSRSYGKSHFLIINRCTQTINTTNTGNNNNIFTFKKSRSSRMSKFIYFIIY